MSIRYTIDFLKWGSGGSAREGWDESFDKLEDVLESMYPESDEITG